MLSGTWQKVTFAAPAADGLFTESGMRSRRCKGVVARDVNELGNIIVLVAERHRVLKAQLVVFTCTAGWMGPGAVHGVEGGCAKAIRRNDGGGRRLRRVARGRVRVRTVGRGWLGEERELKVLERSSTREQVRRRRSLSLDLLYGRTWTVW